MKTTEVVKTETYNCMVWQVDEHDDPRTHTVCEVSGAYIDLHPYSSSLFRKILTEKLGIKNPKIIKREWKIEVLETPKAPLLATA